MTKAVRYYSKLGNTKTIAEAIAEGAGVPAVSISDEPELKERVDIRALKASAGSADTKEKLRNETGKRLLHMY